MTATFSSVPVASPGTTLAPASAGGGEPVPGQDLEPLLEQFLTSILALAGAQAGAVRVLSDDGEHMRLLAQQGLPPQVLASERLVPRDCGMCGVAAGQDVLAWVEDVRACERHSHAQGYFGLQCQRVLAISLRHGAEVLGIYTLFFERATPLTPETENMLRLIGQLLGLTLHNAGIERERLRLTVMKERQELVNEVHDAIAQTLAYVKMRLPLLHDAVLAHDDPRSLKYLGDVRKAVGEVHDNLREVMTFFRTRMDPLGLLHALQGIADGFFDRTGITLEIRNSMQNLGLTDEQEVQVFHIVQESLANIAKHSMAAHAVLSIQRTGAGLEFLIEDDGRGMATSAALPADTASTHLGLDIMQGRARRLGGQIEVTPNAAGGTRVRLVLPGTSSAGVEAHA